VRVAAAGIRQHEEARAVHRRVLKARRDCRRLRLRRAKGCLRQCVQERPVHGHADEGDDVRAKAIDLSLEDLPAFEVFSGLQHVDAGTRARDQVRHAQVPLGQPHVPFVRNRLRHDA